jgi:uncharacterized protein GlcG (DUF336 family)
MFRPGPSGRKPRIAKDGVKFNGGTPCRCELSARAWRLVSYWTGWLFRPGPEPASALSAAAKDANIGGTAAMADREGNVMRCLFWLASVAAAAAALMSSPASAQVLMQRDVSLKMALAIAETAIAECEKAGNDVSVAVVDRAGRLRVFLQGDKAAPHNIELAERKAYTARTFGRSSADWAERTMPGSELAAQRQLDHVIALRGGVPIKVGDDTIGAVGVSGSTSGGDEACAMAGVAKVQDQLK